MKVIIWCKVNCIFCDLAKKELTKRGLSYEERTIGKGWTKEQLLKEVPNAKKIPQIFIGNTLVGGYNELMSFKT